MPNFTTAALTAGLTLIPLTCLAQPPEDPVVEEAVVTASRAAARSPRSWWTQLRKKVA